MTCLIFAPAGLVFCLKKEDLSSCLEFRIAINSANVGTADTKQKRNQGLISFSIILYITRIQTRPLSLSPSLSGDPPWVLQDTPQCTHRDPPLDPP